MYEGTKKLSVELVDERALTHDADGLRFPLHDAETDRPFKPRKPLGPMNNTGHQLTQYIAVLDTTLFGLAIVYACLVI